MNDVLLENWAWRRLAILRARLAKAEAVVKFFADKNFPIAKEYFEEKDIDKQNEEE